MVVASTFMEARHAPIGNTFLTDEQEAELISAFDAFRGEQRQARANQSKLLPDSAATTQEGDASRDIRTSGCGSARRRSKSTSSVTILPKYAVADISPLSPSVHSSPEDPELSPSSPRPVPSCSTPPWSTPPTTPPPPSSMLHSLSSSAASSPGYSTSFSLGIVRSSSEVPLTSAAIDHRFSTMVLGCLDGLPSSDQCSKALADTVVPAPTGPWQRSVPVGAQFPCDMVFGPMRGAPPSPPPPVPAPTVFSLGSPTAVPSSGWTDNVKPIPLHLEQALLGKEDRTAVSRRPLCSGIEALGSSSPCAPLRGGGESCSSTRVSEDDPGMVTVRAIFALASKHENKEAIYNPDLHGPLPGNPIMKPPLGKASVRERLRKRGMGVLEECSLP